MPEEALPEPEPPELHTPLASAGKRPTGAVLAGGVVVVALLAVGGLWTLHGRTAPPIIVATAPAADPAQDNIAANVPLVPAAVAGQTPNTSQACAIAASGGVREATLNCGFKQFVIRGDEFAAIQDEWSVILRVYLGRLNTRLCLPPGFWLPCGHDARLLDPRRHGGPDWQGFDNGL